jgi:hypothetical protein
MGKRRVVADDSADEDRQSEGTPTSKRARTEAGNEGQAQQIKSERSKSKGKGKGKGKGKSQQIDEGESHEIEELDEESEEEVDAKPVLEDDEKFEEEHGEAVRAAIEAKRKIHGVRGVKGLFIFASTASLLKGIAEHGIIEAIEMHQFMCHKYLTFTFGPQINFIIGGFFAHTWNLGTYPLFRSQWE